MPAPAILAGAGVHFVSESFSASECEVTMASVKSCSVYGWEERPLRVKQRFQPIRELTPASVEDRNSFMALRDELADLIDVVGKGDVREDKVDFLVGIDDGVRLSDGSCS